jgi:simple sugar transport system permease protein
MVVIAAGFMLLALAVVFKAVGVAPGRALASLLTTAFTSGYHFSEALVKTTPIIFTGLAVTCCLKMRLWNIGAEGQLYMGAFGAVWAAQTFKSLPAWVLVPLMIICAGACGGALGALVGFLKKRLGVNEILTSLLLNYVATSLVNYFTYGPWRDPANPGFPITTRFTPAAQLPTFFNTRLHVGFPLALAAAALIWFLIEKTSFGYEIRATGESAGGARYAGIPIGRNIALIFALSGLLAAMAGFGEVAGLHHKLQPGNVSSNYGSYGILVAWLAGANPLALIPVAFCTGALLIGAESLQISLGVSSDMVQITIGLLLAIILICKFFIDNRLVIVFDQGKGRWREYLLSGLCFSTRTPWFI